MNVADRIVKNGRIQQTVCGWCYPKMTLEELATAAKTMGLVGIDLLTPKQFPVVQDQGLVCTMTTSHSIEVGLNDPANHDSTAGTDQPGNRGQPTGWISQCDLFLW